MAAGRNLLLQGLSPSNQKARFGVGRQDSRFQPDFYLVVAAGCGEAAGGLVLEREVILGCEATEVLRSRIPETLFEALLLPNSLPWLVGLCGYTVHLDPPRYSTAPRGSQDLCLVKKPQMAEGKLLPQGALTLVRTHPSQLFPKGFPVPVLANRQGRAGWTGPALLRSSCPQILRN